MSVARAAEPPEARFWELKSSIRQPFLQRAAARSD
jgi:hypothetical protein